MGLWLLTWWFPRCCLSKHQQWLSSSHTLGHPCIPRLSLFPGPVCSRSSAKLWRGVGLARAFTQLGTRGPWCAGHSGSCGAVWVSADNGHSCSTWTTPQAPGLSLHSQTKSFPSGLDPTPHSDWGTPLGGSQLPVQSSFCPVC